MASSSLVRTSNDKVIAGVCGGLSRLLNIDANIIRVVFVIAGVVLQVWWIYLVLWLLLPDDTTGSTGLIDLKRLLSSGSGTNG
ncbi:MAG: PspC domain-containing protein [Propioniciclava sp.]